MEKLVYADNLQVHSLQNIFETWSLCDESEV